MIAAKYDIMLNTQTKCGKAKKTVDKMKELSKTEADYDFSGEIMWVNLKDEEDEFIDLLIESQNFLSNAIEKVEAFIDNNFPNEETSCADNISIAQLDEAWSCIEEVIRFYIKKKDLPNAK